ncbi:MAG TPA: RNA polymerase sigma factor [Polyangiaceae bacterium]|nr:RNA polymerase sigma factor [Polyangiaceae bacterium]
MNDEVDEESLMVGYISGDKSAFERLFRRLGPKIYGFFMRSFGDPTVADELLQTTFFNVHRFRESYRAGMPLRPWLFTIAANVRQDELRRRYRSKEDYDEKALLEADEARSLESVPRDVDDDRASRVRAALERLPEGQRTIVHLHRYEGLTFPQIGEMLGITSLAVRARAFRAYEQLRKELGDLVQQRSDHGAA